MSCIIEVEVGFVCMVGAFHILLLLLLNLLPLIPAAILLLLLQNDGVSCLATSILIKVSSKYGIQSMTNVSCDVWEINGSKEDVHIFLCYNAALLLLLLLLLLSTFTDGDDESEDAGRCSAPLMLFWKVFIMASDSFCISCSEADKRG